MMWRVTGRSPRGVAAAILVVAGLSVTISVSAAGGAEDRAANKAHHGVRLHALAQFNQPTFAAGPRKSNHLVFVTERQGRIRVLHDERKAGTFLDMRHWVGCCEVETGLFSITFPPDYNRTRKFYVYFTNKQRNIEIDQFKRSRKNPAKANRGSRRKIIEVNQTGPVNHNGGTVAVGPNGLLYAATGDGGNFQNTSHAPQRKVRSSASCCGSTRTGASTAATTASRRGIPTWASAAATRSTPAAYATRSASRSTASES